MRIKKIIYWAGLLLVCVPALAFAAAADGGGSTVTWMQKYNINHLFVLTPQLTDVSLSYLRQIFGSVGTALQGGSGQLVGEIFGMFNAGIWAIAIALVSATTIISVLNTAGDGRQIMRSTNILVAARSVIGVLILVPRHTGYSIIQVLLMTAVIKGVGLADHVWESALVYIEQGGTIYSVPDEHNKKDFDKIMGSTADILRSGVCMYAMQKQAQQDSQAALRYMEERPYLAKQYPDLYHYKVQVAHQTANYMPIYGPYTVSFGGDTLATKNVCGQYTWKTEVKGAPLTFYDPYKKAAVQQMVNDLLPLADHLVNLKHVPAPKDVPQYPPASRSLVAAAADYLGIVRPARFTEGQALRLQGEAHFEQAKKEGWISAGRYYRTIFLEREKMRGEGSLGENYGFTPVVTAPKPKISADIEKLIKEKYVPDANAITQLMYKADTDLGEGTLDEDKKTIMDVTAAEAAAGKVEANTGDIFHEVRSLTTDTVMKDINRLFNTVLDQWFSLNMVALHQENASPMARLQQFGATLIAAPVAFFNQVTHDVFDALNSTAMHYFLIQSGLEAVHYILGLTSFIANLLAKVLQFIPFFQDAAIALKVASIVTAGVGGGFASAAAAQPMFFYITMLVSMFYLPFGVAFAVPLFAMGLALGIYLPFIPYLFFVFAAIGWLLLVVESMVAAPLVALGITHPEGHDFLGRAEQAGILILTVFLRPACIIIGLLLGLVLAFVAMRVVNMGFFYILHDTLGTVGAAGSDINLARFLAGISLMGIYSFLMLTVLTQCFKLTYEVGNKVTRWLGGRSDSQMIPHMVQQIKARVNRFAEEVGTGGKEMATKTREAPLTPAGPAGAGKPPRYSTTSKYDSRLH